MEEPGSLFTDYSYNVFGKLSTATMTRSGVTQTRTWNYDAATQRLSSVTLPETGTTSFTYDAQGLVASKTDAKLQRIEYVRDSYNRVTQIKRFNASGVEQVAQRTTFEYDTTENGWGRLGRVYYNNGNERFGYTAGGLIKKKTLSAQYSLTLEYGYNNEGVLVSTKLPQAYERVNSVPQPLPIVTYEQVLDAFNRPIGLKENTWDPNTNATTSTDLVTSVVFDAASRMMGASILWAAETRTFNDRGQMTGQTTTTQSGTLVSLTYTFDAVSNDGRLRKRKNNVSGEEVQYTYTLLGQLATAETTGAGGWGQSFVYDGFGNLRQQNVTKGTAPMVNLTIDATNNRVAGEPYDANGNWTPTGFVYDIENRLVQSPSGTGQDEFEYSARNERFRIYRRATGEWETHLYGIDGAFVSAYRCDSYNGWCMAQEKPGRRRVYFAGHPIREGAERIVTDRLGSVVSRGGVGYNYYPYGEAYTTPPSPPTERAGFATYTREPETGLDYAINRYYQRINGRFATAVY